VSAAGSRSFSVHGKQRSATLNRQAFAHLGATPVDAIRIDGSLRPASGSAHKGLRYQTLAEYYGLRPSSTPGREIGTLASGMMGVHLRFAQVPTHATPHISH
jgi:hypothetical protein